MFPITVSVPTRVCTESSVPIDYVTESPNVNNIALRRGAALPEPWDRVYGAAVTHRLCAMGIRDKPISPGSPWQNGFAPRRFLHLTWGPRQARLAQKNVHFTL
jgi:hypothetical protein